MSSSAIETVNNKITKNKNLLDPLELPLSRQILLRKVKSIGGEGMCTQDNPPLNNFITLKHEQRLKIGKVFRKSANDVECKKLLVKTKVFGLREINVSTKQQPQIFINDPINEINYEGSSDASLLIQHSQQVDQFNYFNMIGCTRCHSNITKVAVPIRSNNQTLHLSVPQAKRQEKAQFSFPLQKKLKPHNPLLRQNLPPILFQAHLPKPPKFNNDESIVSVATNGGTLQFGRIAEGIDQERVNMQLNQKLLQQIKVKSSEKPISHNLSLKKVNIVKTHGGGNVLGKAYSTCIKQKLEQNIGTVMTKIMEKSLVREKEKEIDDLIFGRKQDTFMCVTEQKIDMKDFI